MTPKPSQPQIKEESMTCASTPQEAATNVFIDKDRVIYLTPHTHNDVMVNPDEGHTSTDFPFWTTFLMVGHMCDAPVEISDGMFAFISDDDDMLLAIDMPSPLSNGVPKEATISVLRDYLNEDEITDIIENAQFVQTGPLAGLFTPLN